MLRSMTGFGKATRECNGDVLTVELSAVNRRFFDCFVRLPAPWLALEGIVKETVRCGLSRGKVNVLVNRKRGPVSTQTVRFDEHLARQYVDASRALATLLNTEETLPLTVLAQLEGVFYHEEPEEDLERIEAVLTGAVTEALNRLNAMRVTEGEVLARDLRHRVQLVRTALVVVEERLPALNKRHEERLRARISELRTDPALTEERIAIEVALLAEKGDVTEEVVRLKAHLDHMIELLAAEEPVGRRLDFLSQELLREANTLGVKTRDGDVTKEVLGIKAELEKIREQLQNIE